jgi:hypothetical protein
VARVEAEVFAILSNTFQVRRLALFVMARIHLHRFKQLAAIKSIQRHVAEPVPVTTRAPYRSTSVLVAM